jgi:hypothetical protein
LKHALLCLGIVSTERQISQAMRARRWRCVVTGLDEGYLLRGIERFSCEPVAFHLSDPEKAKKKIDGALDRGNPVIVCLDDWGHWSVIGGRKSRRYLWIDSDRRGVVGTSTWKELRRRLRCRRESEPYYGIALRPQTAEARSRSLVRNFAEVAPLLQESTIRKSWGQYLGTADFALKPSVRGSLSSVAFFEDHREELIAKAPSAQRAAEELQRLAAFRRVSRLLRRG